MDKHEFDEAVVAAVFQRAGLVGWADTNVAEAARDAGLDLGRARERFPTKSVVLMRFGALADRAVLEAAPHTGTPREKLFDLVMARIDRLQAQREGVLALMQALRFDPGSALLVYGGTLRSMRWLLDAAGVPSAGLVGQLRIHGLAAVWAMAVRAWEKDDSADLGATMAAVDRALDRAVQAEASLPGARTPPSADMGVEPLDETMAAGAPEPPITNPSGDAGPDATVL